MGTVKNYRAIVLYTLTDADRQSFVNELQQLFGDRVETLKDQSSIAIPCDLPSSTAKQLKDVCKSFKRTEDTFVNLYYSAALANVEHPDNGWDCIVELNVF